MGNANPLTIEDSLRERALQILNLKYPIELDIKDSHKRRTLEYHPDRHPNIRDNPDKLREYQNKMMVVNQSYELLLDGLHHQPINLDKYRLLEDTALVQSLLPEKVKPVPLGKTEQELWLDRCRNLI